MPTATSTRPEEILRTKGLASAQGRAGRSANQGLVEAYIHFNNTVGAMVEVNCETDFVANTEEFKQLARDLALHVASPSAPRYVSRDEVDPEVLESERRIFEAQARELGKPDDVIPRDRRWQAEDVHAETVLLDQAPARTRWPPRLTRTSMASGCCSNHDCCRSIAASSKAASASASALASASRLR